MMKVMLAFLVSISSLAYGMDKKFEPITVQELMQKNKETEAKWAQEWAQKNYLTHLKEMVRESPEIACVYFTHLVILLAAYTIYNYSNHVAD